MTKATCGTPGCEKPHRARGLCATHYNQQQPGRHKPKPVACAACGAEVQRAGGGGKGGPRRPACSDRCRYYLTNGTWPEQADLLRTAQQAQHRADAPQRRQARALALRSTLRVAVEDGGDVVAAIRERVTVNEAGCWVWPKTKDGYPVATIGKRWVQVHRLSLEARLGKPLGDQPAHHICANSACVNPEHLQPVTHRENSAEMLARRYMERRIAALEDALALAVPDHPLLGEVGLGSPSTG